jgi:hypothetical protein
MPSDGAAIEPPSDKAPSGKALSAISVAFVGALVYHCPALVPLFQEHLEDQEGEVLPHLFVADLWRWIEARSPWDDMEPSELLTQILAFLEAAVSRDDEVAEVIHASFLEHLPRPGEPGAEIRAMLGPALTERLHQIG